MSLLKVYMILKQLLAKNWYQGSTAQQGVKQLVVTLVLSIYGKEINFPSKPKRINSACSSPSTTSQACHAAWELLLVLGGKTCSAQQLPADAGSAAALRPAWLLLTAHSSPHRGLRHSSALSSNENISNRIRASLWKKGQLNNIQSLGKNTAVFWGSQCW